MPDFTVANEGSIFMVQPISEAAQAWVDDNVDLEGWQWLGNRFAVEHRYVEAIVEGMRESGFEVELS